MAELRDMVESHIVLEAKRQKEHYDKHTKSREFCEGNAVWLQTQLLENWIQSGKVDGL